MPRIIIMEPPNYFLADLPALAVLTPAVVADACATLKRNRERYLAGRPTEQIVRVLCDVAGEWLDPNYPFRQRALEIGPEHTGFSRETISVGLTDFFSHWTRENFHALILQDLGHLNRLDGMTATEVEQRQERACQARGPELIAQIAGGQLPNPVLLGMALGFLARSAQFVKCASGTALIPRLFAHSIYEADSKLAACLEVAEWKGGALDLESALFESVDCVSATGEDSTLDAIRRRVPSGVKFLGYGHRLSLGYVTHEILSGINPRKVAREAARDVAAWDQTGCMSPHVFYVETGGKISPLEFAGLLAVELDEIEGVQPRGRLTPEEAAGVARRRGFYEIRAAHSSATRMWQSKESTAWTVVYEEDPQFQISCLHRFVYVKSVANLEQAIEGADRCRGHVSTVGLAATEDRAQALARRLAGWGVSRVCRIGQMQNPPLLWRHDGRPSLGDLVTWTDWEW